VKSRLAALQRVKSRLWRCEVEERKQRTTKSVNAFIDHLQAAKLPAYRSHRERLHVVRGAQA
jgi:hypothetical protein